jgi:DNA-binding response OmpR family regulator
MPGPKVLIIEDEFLIRLALAEALADDGFEVIEAATGEEGLQALKDDLEVALLLTDIQLPGALNGLEVARRAREAVPALQVIFVTGRPEHIPAGGASHDVFIAKPYLPSEICAAARRLTGR